MSEPLCIYHGNCADGFTAAWAVRQALGPIECVAATHGNPPPDVTGRDVIMVDFSYKRPVLEEMAQQARSILILDHHKSAAEDLEPFKVTECGGGRLVYDDVPDMLRDLAELWRPPVIALFDMERSGAGLAWDFFHDAPRPALIDHVEDRDLFRFALEGTREIQAAVFAREYDFALWDELMETPLERLRAEGEAIERKHHKDVRELVDVTMRYMVIAGHRVPVANVPYTLTSDAGHLMAEGNPFAACYWDTPDGRVFSLRSHPDGADVSEIATQYGGGGHKHAAGFRMPIGWEGEA
ncbi:phosphohydrolase [Sediminicurvatus halobius]|uniref:Phosphohydrolase n=1 Tax=Sediminicurvatus halobius TaxID=2182432 RepID=A0A2U2MYF2_9GAMM|nr:phosphohydrolase [Spiribacter halobius]PWG61734.1 phosphohydrolase [Spiribacter halobius]UEX76837.1 hypothetical protein LMH63_12815 [Spiribacter halobius]